MAFKSCRQLFSGECNKNKFGHSGKNEYFCNVFSAAVDGGGLMVETQMQIHTVQ
jgi:hypothetical protein